MMKLASWNVNSLKVRLPHVLDWLEQHQPDLLGLQEIVRQHVLDLKQSKQHQQCRDRLRQIITPDTAVTVNLGSCGAVFNSGKVEWAEFPLRQSICHSADSVVTVPHALVNPLPDHENTD